EVFTVPTPASATLARVEEKHLDRILSRLRSDHLEGVAIVLLEILAEGDDGGFGVQFRASRVDVPFEQNALGKLAHRPGGEGIVRHTAWLAALARRRGQAPRLRAPAGEE